MRCHSVAKPHSIARSGLRRWAVVCLLAMALIVARGGWLIAHAHGVAPAAGTIAAGTIADDASTGDNAFQGQHHPAKPDTACRLRSTAAPAPQHDGPGAAPAPAALAGTAPPDLAAPGSMIPNEVVASPSERRALLQVYLN